MKKVIISVSTSWCGVDQEYSCIAPDNYNTDKAFQRFCQDLSYENFESHGCSEYVVELMFDWDEDLFEETGDGYTQEQYDKAMAFECDHYEWEVEEIDESDEDELEEWKLYPFEQFKDYANK